MNFRRILSKNSLRSSTSSRKSLNKIDDIKKLQDEIESLKLNTSSLKVLLESRDVAIGNLAREKEKLYVELKSVQRTNRNLQQELVDEREIHSKEKEFLLDNMKRLSLKIANSGNSDVILDEEDHILALQNEIQSKNEVIYNVCSKYFKLKKSKAELQKKFLAQQRNLEETFETIVTALEDNKNSLDLLLDELRKSAEINPSLKKYIKLLKINADLNFENTQLKLFLIDKNELKSSLKSSGIREEAESSEIAVPHCSRSINQFDTHTIKQRQKYTYSVKNSFFQNKTNIPKVATNFSKTNNVFSTYNRKIIYRSMSDSFLPKNFYK